MRLVWVLIGLTPVFAAKTSDEPQILHALNRLTWGPRPRDVDAVSKVGLSHWIDQQLHPETITENPTLLEKLATLDTLNLSQTELAARYPSPQAIRAMAEGRTPWPTDLQTRAVVQRMAERQKAKKAGKDSNITVPRRALTEKPEEFVATLEAMTTEERIATLQGLTEGALRRLYPVASPGLRRRIQMFNGPKQVVSQDLVQARLVRAVYSNRQLEDVLADFWFNHFNVYLDKGADRFLVTAYERDVIRPRVLGKFHDLLLATAQSPAMLFYLDNWQSTGPGAKPKGKRAGLNENYGRELMELHTLGVDGGYTQQDVTEVARCFTGWTIRDVKSGGEFFFNPRTHDIGEKHVLGFTIAGGGGMQDGLKVLDILARQPSTARFISRKLAERFVADDPPAALLDRMAKAFLVSDGDLRVVMTTMIAAPEFRDPANFRTRVKSPLELVASAIRATGADIDYALSLATTLTQMGEPLYRKVEPTGYPNRGVEWMNSASLVARMNFAGALTSGSLAGVTLDAKSLPDTDNELARALLGGPASAATRAAILSSRPGGADDGTLTDNLDAGAARRAAGILIGSPEFQRK